MLLSNLVFSLRLPNIIGQNYQRMLILLTYKEPMNKFFDTVLRVKIFVEGRGVRGDMESRYTELALYGSKNECARTDNVYFPISEVCDGTVSLKLDLELAYRFFLNLTIFFIYNVG